MRRALALLVLALLAAGCAAPAAERAQADAEPLDPASDDAPAAPAPTPATPTEQRPQPRPATPANQTQQPPEEGPASNETQAHSEPGPFDPEHATEPCDSLELRSPLVTDTTGLATGWPLLQLDVVMLADPTFVAAHPDDWRVLLENLVFDASTRYEAQMGLRLRAVLIDRLPDGSLDPSAPLDGILPVARGYMTSNHPDVAFDLVALILGADYAGMVAGMVHCVGGAYTPDTAYLFSEYTGPREPIGGLFMNDIPLKVFMHEAGHLLGAHHHYSNCGEALLEYRTNDASAVCDVMINDIGLASFRFSPLNRLVMRSFVEEHGIGTAV